ncbi:MAG: chemotaxis protein CheW [Phycisphaeraceae bacterium]
MSSGTLTRQMDREPASEAAGEAKFQLVTFGVGDEEFAIDILAVQEINRMVAFTRVPQSPADVCGVMNLRGQIVPVVDLRERFEIRSGKEPGHDARIIVVQVSGRTIGFTVDWVHEVMQLDSRVVQPAPAITSSVRSDYIRGVGMLDDRLLILLDLERLFAEATLDELEDVVRQAGAQAV